MTDTSEFGDRLAAHLREWAGDWPPPASGVRVVGSSARLLPTWDGSIRPLMGVGNGAGAVISVRPEAVDAVRDAFGSSGPGRFDDDLGDRLSVALGVGPSRFGSGVFRTTADVPSSLGDLGEWHETQTPGLPEWLAPFNGPRLVARDDDGAVIAGVGIKVHDRFGQELSVVTEEAARGRGFARRLVATAARRILDEGAVPTYLHHPSNAASAHVAEAVGFADRGWTVHGLWPE